MYQKVDTVSCSRRRASLTLCWQDQNGHIDYHEFKRYYRILYKSYLGKGLDMGQLKQAFKNVRLLVPCALFNVSLAQLDSGDGAGIVSIENFKHAVRDVCGEGLSAEEIDHLAIVVRAQRWPQTLCSSPFQLFELVSDGL
jgi:hypothetical protein